MALPGGSGSDVPARRPPVAAGPVRHRPAQQEPARALLPVPGPRAVARRARAGHRAPTRVARLAPAGLDRLAPRRALVLLVPGQAGQAQVRATAALAEPRGARPRPRTGGVRLSGPSRPRPRRDPSHPAPGRPGLRRRRAHPRSRDRACAGHVSDRARALLPAAALGRSPTTTSGASDADLRAGPQQRPGRRRADAPRGARLLQQPELGDVRAQRVASDHRADQASDRDRGP